MVITSAMSARGSVVQLFPYQIGAQNILRAEYSDLSDTSPVVWRKLQLGPLPSLTDGIPASAQRRHAERSLPDAVGLAPFAVPLYTYDFPGGPGSGLASKQTNAQPAGATNSDFTRPGLTVQGTANIFDSKGWPTTTTINPSVFASFTVRASPGLGLSLSQLVFSALRNNNGPLNGEVGLFLNGATTAAATFDYVPPATASTFTFDLTGVAGANNATSATFEFFGWTSKQSDGTLGFDNVQTFASVVPETAPWFCTAFVALLAALTVPRHRRLAVANSEAPL